MFCNRIKVTVSFAIMLFATAAGCATNSPENIRKRMGDGDPVAGADKIAICMACHAVDGNSTASNYPKLAGQYGDYILKQLIDFRSGDRKDPMISAMVQSAGNDQDLLDIAAYYASQDQMKSDKWSFNRAGKKRFNDVENGCVNCHGANGKGMAPDQSHAPVIGGQQKSYLIKQLKSFRSGERANDPGGIMGSVTASMSDDEIENIASYVSGL